MASASTRTRLRVMPVLPASSSSVTGPAASPANSPTSLATKRCLAAMKPLAISKITSGVMACAPAAIGCDVPFAAVDIPSSYPACVAALGGEDAKPIGRHIQDARRRRPADADGPGSLLAPILRSHLWAYPFIPCDCRRRRDSSRFLTARAAVSTAPPRVVQRLLLCQVMFASSGFLASDRSVRRA